MVVPSFYSCGDFYAIPGAQKGVKSEGLCNPCLLKGPIVQIFSTPVYFSFPMDVSCPCGSFQPHGACSGVIWLQCACLLRDPMAGRNEYIYINPAFSGSPYWGEINMATQTLAHRGPRNGGEINMVI